VRLFSVRFTGSAIRQTVIDNTESRRAISFDVCLLRELDNASEQTSSDDNGVMVIAV